MNVQSKRLVEAIENFQSRTKGAGDIAPEVGDAVAALFKALNLPAPGQNSPGRRAAMDAVKGTTGTGEPFPKAAKGPDGAAPGQTEGRSVNEQIQQAAADIAARMNK